MKIKLLFMCESMGGGVRKHLLDILYNIDLTTYEVGVIYGNRNDITFEEAIKDLSLKGIRFFKIDELQRELSFKMDLISFFKSILILRQYKPNIVHCHSSKAGGIGRIASKIIGVKKIIYTPHAYMFQNSELNKYKRIFYIMLERILSLVTDVTINVSNGERKNALNKNVVKIKNSIVIYNGINFSRTENIIKEEKIIIGTAARMDDQKDPWTFYRIASKVIKKNANVEFIYIGDGKYKKEIQNEIDREGLNDKIKLTGYRNDVDKIIPYFDIYLITSLYEGMPYSIIEALSVGIPVVATDVEGNNEIIIDNYNGLLFGAKNIEEGVKCVEKLIEDQELRINLGKCSKELYERDFTLNRMIQSLYEVYTLPLNFEDDKKSIVYQVDNNIKELYNEKS